MINIFISYSWANTQSVNYIENSLNHPDINLIRDVRDAAFFHSLNTFMDKIRDCDYALIIISADYLKSEKCIHELIALLKEKDYQKKIMPIVLDDATDIFIVDGQMQYIEYWHKKQEEYEKLTSKSDPLNVTSQLISVSKIREISQKIGDILAFISDLKCESIEHLKETNYTAIFSHIGLENRNEAQLLIDFFNEQNYETREILLDKYSEKVGKDLEYYIAKGFACYFKQNYKSAEYFYNKALEISPNNEVAFNNLGLLFEDTDPEKSKEYYKKAIDSNPNYAEVYDNMANILSDYDEIKEYRENALMLNPNNAGIHYNYARLFLFPGKTNHQIARLHLKEAIKLDPNFADAYDQLADIVVTDKKYQEAINYYEKAIRLGKKHPATYLSLGTAYRQLGDRYRSQENYKKALLNYTECLALDPNELRAMHGISILKKYLS